VTSAGGVADLLERRLCPVIEPDGSRRHNHHFRAVLQIVLRGSFRERRPPLPRSSGEAPSVLAVPSEIRPGSSRGGRARIGHPWSGALERQLGNRRGAPKTAAGPGCFSGSAAFARRIASGGSPRRDRVADPGRSPARRTDSSASRTLSPSHGAARAPRAPPTPAGPDGPGALLSTTREPQCGAPGR
jgi:hypothetical protein